MAKPMSRKEQESKKAKDRERKLAHERHRNRLGILKTGMDLSGKERYKEAVENYKAYLMILEKYFRVDENSISPKHFDQTKDLTELLLISHVYWDLAKIYDRNPNLFRDCEKYLAQFVKFSTGYKYQFVNSEIIRKHIKSGKVRNVDSFKAAHEKLRSTKGLCFVATYSFGDEHFVTNGLRAFRNEVLFQSKLGTQLVETYYEYSPKLISLLCRSPKLGEIFSAIFLRPMVYGIYVFSCLLRNLLPKK